MIVFGSSLDPYLVNFIKELASITLYAASPDANGG